MGDLARTGADSYFKMNVATWLVLILGVITLATPALTSEPRVVCYYTNWSVYRPGTARFNPQNINPYLCTHLIYAFGGFTKDNTLKPFDKYQDIEKGGYAKFTGLKTYNKNLKTMLAIGGWNEGSSRFSPMVASRERRKEFVKNAIKFLRQNRFDGLDLDWEYPAFRDGGKPKDRENYARLVKELREEFNREAEKTNKPRLLLTMAVPAGIEYIQKGFDVKTLNTYLDWMNLLTYDYHSAFEPAVNHHAPLYPLEEPNEYSVDTELNIDYTIKFYLENGADPDKLVLGIPTYGRSYTLFNADAVEIGSPADGPGEQGDATREKGYLAYYEICEALKPKVKKRSISSDDDSEEYSEEEEEEEEWTIMHPNPSAMGPVAYRGNQWVGYDDIDIVKKKAEYVAENGLGGIMFWSIDNDDFRGNCHSKPYPLIEAAKEAYISKLGSTDNILTAPEKTKAAGRPGNRRRIKPKVSITTTTLKPSAAKINKRKSSVSSTPSWNIITPEPPTTPDPGSDFKCVDEGFYQHPRDCKKYFWCLDSGPSNLGIVAHQFTCPSGLFFNKAADSCDFARNVLCKTPAETTKAPATKAPVTKPSTTTPSTTTRKPIKLSTKSTALFRTTSTTAAPEPESEEEYEEDIAEDTFDEDSEDPRVIKELIDLIKKVGGVEKLEKQLHRAESSASTDGGRSTTPSPFNKKLYQKVLERARGQNKYTGNNVSQNSRRGPQSQGIENTLENDRSISVSKDRSLNKDRPQYTTINRNRPSTSTTEEPLESEEEPERPAQLSRARAVESETDGTTAKSLQYVNIRRARPTATSDTADDTASRNALFERSESYVSVSEPSSLDIGSARRENQPEYVTIRRQRPTTEEATTIQYEEADSEVDVRETALEREISSQPQYTSIVRARSTTSPPQEPSTEPTAATRPTYSAPEESSPEPTTVLAVQISSLLNSPNSAEDTSVPETTVAQTIEAEVVATAAPSSVTPRRPLLRRRGSTTTTTTPAPTATTQNARRPFLRRTKATAPPDIAEETTTVDPDYPEDAESLEAGRRDAYEAAKKLKAAAASRLEALASQKEAEAFEKEVVASKKEDEASKLEAEAFVRESAERNSTGTTSRPQRRGPNRFKSRKEAIALRKDAIASRKEAIALRKEAEASRKEVERNATSTDADADARIRGRPSLVADAKPVTTEETTIADVTEDAESLESDRRDAYNAAKKIKAAEASRKEALASQKEAEAFEKEVLASKKDEEASKLEAEAFVREAAERKSTGTTSRPRGSNRFKTRKEAVALRKDAISSRKEAIDLRKEAEASRKEVERNETSVDTAVDAGIRPSLVAGAKRNERPTLLDTTEETTTEDADALEAAKKLESDRRDAFEAAKRIKAAEASQKETQASQKEADAFEKEVLASKKDDDASKLEADAFVREAAERNSTGTTSRPQRRGPNRFKTRKEAVALRKEAIASRKEAVASRKQAEASRKEVERNETSVDAGVDARIRGRRPSLVAGARLTERPASANRSFVRRRQSGGTGSTTTAAPSTSTASVNRRQFRIASRRRPPTVGSTTTTTTSQPTTLMPESEELLQDIGDIDAIEDPTLEPRSAKKGSKIQRRPLVNLKDDQNPSATEEERRRQSKKYSSTFKQNKLEDILKKSEESTTESSTTAEDDAETALAIATHQLITAPLPSTEFEDTSRNTEYTKTPYEEYTTAFRTVPTQDFVQTTVGETYNIFDTPRVTTVDDFTTADLTTKSKRPVYSTTDYETKTTYDAPKTTSSLRSNSNDRTDLNTGKVTLETFPATVPREGYTNIPTFGRLSPTTFEAPKLSTLSRYPTTPVYQTVTNQYVPTTRDYTTARDYTETTDSRSYSTPSTITLRDFSSPNVIISGYAGVQRGEVKFENDKYATIPEVPENTAKYTTVPVEDTRATRARYTTVSEVGEPTVGYTGSSQEPAGFFTREYLLESPFTKTYDDEYQYLSPTTPQTTTRKVFRKKIQRRISTTIRPTTSTVLPARSTTPTYVPEITTRPTLRPRMPSQKPFEKIAKTEPNRTYKPVVNYDYYDDSAEKMALKYAEGTKVILHGKGSVECLDVGNFPHPSSCKKFISCARMEFGSFLGWEYVCPKGLSFDPVGGICNWSAGLGCGEKDDD